MDQLQTAGGIQISYDRQGEGVPLVLIHGAFSDHHTNWEFVKPALAERLAVYALARRGRGQTTATSGHTVADEAQDALALIEHIGQPVFLLGHSYGAHVALAVAAERPDLIRKLVLYEPPAAGILTAEALAELETLAEAGDWEQFTFTFFRDTLFVPVEELEGLQATELWPPIVADAPATLGDLRAIHGYAFPLEQAEQVQRPTLLQYGSESPAELYLTEALAKALPQVQVEALAGQAHEGMTTAPEQYIESVLRFLLGG